MDYKKQYLKYKKKYLAAKKLYGGTEVNVEEQFTAEDLRELKKINDEEVPTLMQALCSNCPPTGEAEAYFTEKDLRRVGKGIEAENLNTLMKDLRYNKLKRLRGEEGESSSKNPSEESSSKKPNKEPVQSLGSSEETPDSDDDN